MEEFGKSSFWKLLLGAVILIALLIGLIIPGLSGIIHTQTIQGAIDSLTSEGYIVLGAGSPINGDLIPNTDNSFDLGSGTSRWASIYGNSGIFSNDLQATSLLAPTGRAATYTIAASNAPAIVKNQADIVLTGTGDITTINSYIAAGRSIQLTQGTYYVETTLLQNANYTTVQGIGKGTSLVAVASLGANPMITMSGTYSTLRDMFINGDTIASSAVYVNGVDAGNKSMDTLENLFIVGTKTDGINLGTTRFDVLKNISIGSTLFDLIPTGINVTANAMSIEIIGAQILDFTSAGILINGSYVHISTSEVGESPTHPSNGIVVRGPDVDIIGCDIADVGRNNILLQNTTQGIAGIHDVRIIGCTLDQASGETANTYDNIAIEAADAGNTIAGVAIVGNHGGDIHARWKYDVDISGFTGNINITGNSQFTKINYAAKWAGGSGTIYVDNTNTGWQTEDSGFATITTGNTEVTVNHAVNAQGGSPLIFLSNFTDAPLPPGTYVHNVNATSFKIYIAPALGANYTFRWYAVARLYN